MIAQTSIVDTPGLLRPPRSPGGMSDAERLRRWRNWEVLVHEYIHTLAHPNFNARPRQPDPDRGLLRAVHQGRAAARRRRSPAAKTDADAGRREEVEGGDVADFEARFVPDYDRR